MTDETSQEGLKERITRQGEDTIGRLAQDLLENPLLNGAITRALDAQKKAAQAQEVAMGALNLPSASDIERLTRRVRSVSQRGEEGNLHWEWTDDVDWEPKVKMKMTSEVANKYFQGKENVAIAIARRRIKTGGDVKAALSLIPITKPIYARYREMLEAEYPHLVV